MALPHILAGGRVESDNMSPRSVLRQPKFTAILDQEYPRFSDAEYARRRQAIADEEG